MDVRDAIAKKKLELEKRAKGILMLSSVLQGWACGIVPNCDTSNPKQPSINYIENVYYIHVLFIGMMI